MRKRKTIYLGVGILVVLVLVIAAAPGGGTPVETAVVQKDDITRAVEDVGYVQPATDWDFYATQNARVADVPVETGQTVKQGETLVLMENLDLGTQVADTQSQLAQAAAAVNGARAALERTRLALQDAKDNLARVKELFQAGAVAQVEYDRAWSDVESSQQSFNEQSSLLDSAQARAEGLNQLMKQLAAKEQQLAIKSPVDGQVLNLPAEKDQVVLPGVLLVSVAVPGQLEIKADILSDDLAEVKIGQKVSVTASVLGDKVMPGVVNKIYPRAEEKQSALGVIQRRVPVIISLPNAANLKPGFEVRVAIQTVSRMNVLMAPRESVRTKDDGSKEVMVITGNRVRHQTVKTGISDRQNIEITGGLNKGDKILRDGGLDLKENAKVKAGS